MLFNETGLECPLHAANVFPFETMKRPFRCYFFHMSKLLTA